MGRSEPASVLLVGGDPLDTAAIDGLFGDDSLSVTVLSALTRLFDELTTGVFHCLVVPATVDGQAGTDIARGVRKLFPDLAIVVTGVDPTTTPEDLDATVIDSTSDLDSVVHEAIEARRRADGPPVAGRPPSPMEMLLLSLFNEMPDHLYAKDEAARHVIMGRGFNEPTDRIGLTDTEVSELADEHGAAALHDEFDVLHARTDMIDVEEFLDLDASYVRTRKVPWYDGDGNIQGLVGLTRDITARKTREHELRRQHERMVKVALVAAHEFRNELQIAHGRLELLDESDDQIEDIQDSLTRITALVDTIVELSTRETKVQKQEPVWLSRLSREVWDTLAEEQASLEVEGDARVLADQESASLLLRFLFQNAIHHAGPAVTVTVGTTDTGFFVADDGPGIDLSPPERVFDAGFSSVEGNTGFGLYIARMVAEDHGWSIALTESTDGGARFDIENVDLHE